MIREELIEKDVGIAGSNFTEGIVFTCSWKD
jgi:hypothetical protein